MSRARLLVIVIVGCVAAVGAVIGATLWSLLPGDPIASVDVRSRERFELSYVSDGESQRVWLDRTYSLCLAGTPHDDISGTVDVHVDGRTPPTVHRVEGFGPAVSSQRVESTIRQSGRYLFSIPAHPSGATVRLSGALEVPSGCREAPMDAQAIRLWVAP